MPTQIVPGATTQEGAVEALTELLAGDVGTAATLHLWTQGFTPSVSSVHADFVAAEANFTGYVAPAIVWSAVGVEGSGLATSHSGSATFIATDAVAPNLIAGAWIDILIGAAHKVANYFIISPPVPMQTALAMMNVNTVVQMPTFSGYATVDS